MGCDFLHVTATLLSFCILLAMADAASAAKMEAVGKTFTEFFKHEMGSIKGDYSARLTQATDEARRHEQAHQIAQEERQIHEDAGTQAYQEVLMQRASMKQVLGDKMCEAKTERECHILYECLIETRSRTLASMDDHSLEVQRQEQLQQEHDPERRLKRHLELLNLRRAKRAQYSRAEAMVEERGPSSPTICKIVHEYHILYDDHHVTKDFENNEDRYYTPFPERKCYKVVKRDVNGEILRIMATV